MFLGEDLSTCCFPNLKILNNPDPQMLSVVFCEYNLVNDSVIEVKYNFPDWTDKINQMENDSLFPKYFYLQQDE